MKSILLFRHAEADYGDSYSKDYDRPLTKKGILDAESMGQYLYNKNEIPQLVISSFALRADSTSNIAIDSGKWSVQKIIKKNIYGGDPNYLLSLAKEQNNKYNYISFVGHEPNFSMFIKLSTSKRYINFPTAAMARIDFEIDDWQDVEFNFGKLKWLVTPKELDSNYI